MSIALCFGLVRSLAGTDVDAEVAAGAVLRRDLDRVALPLVLVALVRRRLERLRRAGERALVVDLRADGGVRTHQRALVALDADLGVPDRDLEREVPLLPFRRGHRPRAVHGKRADRQQVAFSGQDHRRHLLHEVGSAFRHERRAPVRRGDARRDGNLVQVRQRLIHDLAVPAHDLGAPLAVRLLDRLLDVLDRLVARAAGRRSRRNTSA